MKTKIVSILLALCLLMTTAPSAARAVESAPDFYRVSGQQIVDGSGNPVLLKGISFGNSIFANAHMSGDSFEAAIRADHDAASYQELADMGFDHVRFEMNYGLFEDDADPAVTVDSQTGKYVTDTSKYRESGFHWIDENIQWAKAAGMRIILQMEYPVGGYQAATSQTKPEPHDYLHPIGSGGKELWIDYDENGALIPGGKNYQLLQARFIAMWTEIARRYADEPAVIGYGLINEPVVPQVKGSDGKPDAAATAAQLRDLYQRTADSIRTVDKNHILFTQCLISWFDPEDYNSTDWNLMDVTQTMVKIADNNTVYQFHFFEPFAFTHQGANFMPQYAGVVSHYPSSYVIQYDISDWTEKGNSVVGETQTDGEWKYVQSQPFSATESYQVMQAQVSAANLGSGSSVWYDDITVTRTNTETKEKETVAAYDFSTGLGSFQSSGLGPGGTFEWDAAGGRGGGGMKISNATGQWDNVSSWDCIYLEPGFTYQISGWVRNGGSGHVPQARFLHAENVWLMDRAYMEHMMERYTGFMRTYNVPMFVGSWSAFSTCYGKGIENWFDDLTELFEQYGLSSNYHSYHDQDTGLYLIETDKDRTGHLNETVRGLLTTYYVSPVPSDVTENRIISTVCSEDGLAVSLQTIQGGRLIAAVYDAHGKMTDYTLRDVSSGVQAVTLPLHLESGEGTYVKCFLLDRATHIPLSLNFTLP